MSYVVPPTFVAGTTLTAAQLNILGQDIVDLNARISTSKALRVRTSANSGSWNSATKVVTNLAGTFTPPSAGAVYWVRASFNWVCANAGNTSAFGLAWRDGGAITNVSTIPDMIAARSNATATGMNALSLEMEFTSTSTNTHGVGLIGWMPTGDTGATNLFANGTYSVGTLVVQRVG